MSAPTPTLEPAGAGLWTYNAPLSVLGMAIGHRMSVAALPDGTLWLHSPPAYSPALASELHKLGEIAHVVAPNCMHDTYLEQWFAARPTARFHGARGFARYRPDLRFTDTLSNTPPDAWRAVFDQRELRGMPRLNEVVFLHRPTRTLIVTDLAFNLGPDMPLLSRVLLRLNDCYAKFGASRMLRFAIKDKTALRRSLEELFDAWDFDALIVSHGDNLATGAKTALREAFTFL